MSMVHDFVSLHVELVVELWFVVAGDGAPESAQQ